MSLKNRVVDVRHVDPASLIQNPLNYRTHGQAQRSAFRAVLQEIGFAGALLARQVDGGLELIDGHLRAEEVPGGEKVPVVVVDLDEHESRKLLAVYDPISAMAGSDDQRFESLVEGLQFDSQSLQDIVDDMRVEPEDSSRNDDPGATPELAEELQRKWKVKGGDVWQIGRHQLLCGDCTDSAAVQAFVGDWVADSMVTDPPYGVDYGEKQDHLNATQGGSRNAERIASDKGKDYRAFFATFLQAAPLASRNTVYVFMSSQELHNLRLAFDDAKYTWGDYLVWVKNGMVLGRKDYNAKHEFLVYGWKGRHKFFGATNSTTVLEYDRPTQSKAHPTMKPVELVGRILQDGSPIRGRIYEPFSGSGTTFVAAEQTGRECRGVELEAKYCAVALERLSEMGLEARRAS